MQTHEDRDFDTRLMERAEEVMSRRGSEITAGKPGETPIAEYDAYGVRVRRLPADEQGILRISIGGGVRDSKGQDVNYCVFRGSHLRCIKLLQRVLLALEAHTHGAD